MRQILTKYDDPKNGMYKFQIPRWNDTFETHWVKVKVLGETEKSYQIEVIIPFGYHEKGDLLFARKKNVRIDKGQVDTSEFWYNNLEK